MYHVEFSKSALRDLKKMDRHTAALVLGWIRKIWKAVKIPVSTARLFPPICPGSGATVSGITAFLPKYRKTAL